MQVEPVHTLDRFTIGAVLISQAALVWILLRGRRFEWWRIAWLAPIWIVTGYGIWLSAATTSTHRAPGPAWLHSLASSVELLWGLVSIIVVAFYWFYVLIERNVNRRQDPARRKVLRGAAIAVASGPVAAIGFGAIVGRHEYQVREIELPIRDLHPDLVGLRIAQVSDFHVSSFLSPREAASVVAMTNELKPHIAFMTGDLITEEGDPLDDAIREICGLRADSGVFGCMGNHEAYVRCQAYVKQEAARYGVNFLRRENVQLRFGNASLNIAGVDFWASKYRARYLEGAQTLLRPDMTNLLLSHNPDVFPRAAAQGWDAMLAGHTHGGQVTVEIFEQNLNAARFFTPYVAGLYKRDGSVCYVNRGIGTIGMPVRVGEAPEITLLKLVRA